MANTSSRLKQIMGERNLKQADILKLAQPFCEQYGVKLGKSDLSQFVSGKVLPGQWKLTILGLALNVSEAWLMGLDVPPDRVSPNYDPQAEAEAYDAYMKSEAAKMHLTIYDISDPDPQLEELNRNAQQLNAQGLQKLVDYSDDLVTSGKYQKVPLNQVEVEAYRKQLHTEEDGNGA